MADDPPADTTPGRATLAALGQQTSRRSFVAGALVGLAPAAAQDIRVSNAVAPPQLGSTPPDRGPLFVDGGIWQFVRGDLSRQVDGIGIVRSNLVAPSEGAWIRQTDTTIGSRRTDPGAVATHLSDLVAASPRRPEEFGAVGDGVHDDAPAIRRALDAIARTATSHPDGNTRPGMLMLTQGKRYRCGSRIVVDRRFHNVFGFATLDFSGWSGVYVQVTGTLTEFGNAYGQSGCLEGQIVILGARGAAGSTSVGILYDTPIAASTTSIRTVGVTVCRCDVGFQIGARGYNQDFVSCKAFDCDIVFDWQKEVADNDERTSVFGGTFYNSRLFLRHQRGAGAFYVFGSSIDYTEAVVDVLSGKVQMFGVHLESSRWADRPIKVAGDGGLFTMQGGWILMMENAGGATHLVEVQAGCTVSLRDVITHGVNALKPAAGNAPTTWATGPGRFEMHGTQPAFQYGGFPARLHDSYNVLADPGFDEPDIQLAPVWRIADIHPIRSRDGSDTPGAGGPPHNIVLGRVTREQMEGAGCLRVDKRYGGGSPAAMTLISIPVRYGDRAKGGFRIAAAPDRPGSNRQIYVRGGFAVLDGTDQFGVPIIRRFASPGEQEITPHAGSYILVSPGNGASDSAAPSWATHYLVQVDFRSSDQASFLIDGRWADRW